MIKSASNRIKTCVQSAKNCSYTAKSCIKNHLKNERGAVDDAVSKVLMVCLGLAIVGSLFAMSGTAIMGKAKVGTTALYNVKVTSPSAYNMATAPSANSWVTNATSDANSGILQTIDMSK